LYGVHELIDRYLGPERARAMIEKAARESAWRLSIPQAKVS